MDFQKKKVTFLVTCTLVFLISLTFPVSAQEITLLSYQIPIILLVPGIIIAIGIIFFIVVTLPGIIKKIKITLKKMALSGIRTPRLLGLHRAVWIFTRDPAYGLPRCQCLNLYMYWKTRYYTYINIFYYSI